MYCSNKKETIIEKAIKLAKESVSKMTNVNDKKSINVEGKCPYCGGDIIHVGEFYGCSNMISGECNYKVKSSCNGEDLDFNVILELEKYKKLMLDYESKGVVVGACPLCGEDVVSSENNYICCNCDYELEDSYCETKIEEKEIELLLNNKQTNLLTLHKENGSCYTAKLMLEQRNFKYAVVPGTNNDVDSIEPELKENESNINELDTIIDDSKISSETNETIVGEKIGICPKCKSCVVMRNNEYICSNDKCDISVQKFRNGGIISKENAILLFSEKKSTNQIWFISKKDKNRFKASLTFTKKHALQFSFDSEYSNRKKDGKTTA